MTGTLDTPHTAKLVNGTYSGINDDYEEGIGQTTLKVFCNDGAGFAIYAIGYTNDEYGNNYLHWNKAASTSDHTEDIATGIYNPNTTVNSTWSMKLAALSGTYAATIDDGVQAHNGSTEDYTDWHEVPDAYQRVAYRTSGTDVEVSGVGTGSSITVTYDSYISGTQAPGTYVGQVKYTLVHPSVEGAPVTPLNPSALNITNAIIYAPNTSDIIGSMSSLPQTTATITNASPQAGAITAPVNSTTTLIAPNFKRAGYGFAGWSTDFTATSTSTIYGPNETISTNPTNGGLDVSGGAVLYPVWIESADNFQSWSGCSSLTPASYNGQTGALTATLSSITALTDTRDENVYTVARLADGLCWMTENLRLNSEHTTSTEDIAKAQGYGSSTTYGNFIGLADSEDANFNDTNPPVANTLYSTDGANNTININATYSSYPYTRLPRYNNNNTNMAMGATNSDGTTTLEDKYNYYDDATKDNHLRWYGYGNYYNWPAAMASTTYYNTYSGTTGSDAAGTSLCPLGWHLPLGDISSGTLADGANDSANRVGSFSYLDRRMGGTGQGGSTNSITSTTMSTYWRKFPNNFVYSGAWNVAQTYYRSTRGFYWSSSAISIHNTRSLFFDSSDLHPGTNNYTKYSGSSIRCVAN